MQTSQSVQLKSKRNKAELLDILIIIWSFSNAVLHSFLYFFNLQSKSGQLGLVYVFVAVLSGLLCFRYFSRKIPFSFLYLVSLFIIIGFSFIFTRFRYGIGEPMFISEFKSYFGMVICTLLIAVLINWRNKKDIDLNVVFITVLILTLVSFLSLFMGDSKTSSGYIRDSSGLIYQNVSYYSAYAFGLTIFHMTEIRKEKSISPFLRIIYAVLLLLQLTTCVLSGGRGGLVLLVILLVFGIVIFYGFKKSYKLLVPALILVFFIMYVLPRIMSLSGINVNGLVRIMRFLNIGFVDNGRAYLMSQSIDIIGESPVLGHGIGSVFFYLHAYSHNMFTDILIETGILGLFVFVVIFLAFVLKSIKLYKQGSLYRFMVIIFVCGIALNMFSGYIWVNQHVWLPFTIIMLTPINKRIEK